MNVRIASAFGLIGSLLVAGLVSAAEPAKPAAIKIAMVGDSTMASYANPPVDRPDLTGWGQVFGTFFDDSVTIVNLARSGASSKSFRTLKLWDKALAEKPDYVFIQFGHNDGPGKGDRSSDPQTEYPENLRRFIDEAKAIGAKPILVTPVTRRIYVNGKISSPSLEPYVAANIAVGAEKQVSVIDLYGASVALFNQLGDEGSADLSPSTADRTHFSRKGAMALAKLVAERVSNQVPLLESHLKLP